MTRFRRILLINPNTSSSMTELMLAHAGKYVAQSATIQALTAPFGSPCIVSRATYAVAAHAAIETYAGYNGTPPDVVVLCCFGDPGLEALREIVPKPIVGLAEASIRAAEARCVPFAIITLGTAWVAMLEERLILMNAKPHCVGIYAVEATGRDLETDRARVIELLDRAAAIALQAGAVTIVLGGGALAGIAGELTTHARYIDCIEAAMDEAMSYPR